MGKSFRMKIEPWAEKAKVLLSFFFFIYYMSWQSSDSVFIFLLSTILLTFWQSAAEYLIRVSFGTTLVASIVLVFTAILVAASSGRYVCKALHVHMSYILFISVASIRVLNSRTFILVLIVMTTVARDEEADHSVRISTSLLILWIYFGESCSFT